MVSLFYLPWDAPSDRNYVHAGDYDDLTLGREAAVLVSEREKVDVEIDHRGRTVEVIYYRPATKEVRRGY